MFSHGKCRICPVFMRFPKDRIEKMENPKGDGNSDSIAKIELQAYRENGKPQRGRKLGMQSPKIIKIIEIEKMENPKGDGNDTVYLSIVYPTTPIEKMENPKGDGNLV